MLVIEYTKMLIFTDISLNICCQKYTIYLDRSLDTFFLCKYLKNHKALDIGKIQQKMRCINI